LLVEKIKSASGSSTAPDFHADHEADANFGTMAVNKDE